MRRSDVIWMGRLDAETCTGMYLQVSEYTINYSLNGDNSVLSEYTMPYYGRMERWIVLKR
jgi:hypothetical protein